MVVLEADHVVEHGHFNPAALRDRRLLEIALGADVTYDTLAVEAFLEAAERAFNGLAFLYIDFYCHKGDKGSGFAGTRQIFFKQKTRL
jgi:hypothetical protein